MDQKNLFSDFDTHRVLVEHICLIILSEIPQVDINETDEYGFTGLHMASENGHLKVLKEMKKLLCAAHCRCFLKK